MTVAQWSAIAYAINSIDDVETAQCRVAELNQVYEAQLWEIKYVDEQGYGGRWYTSTGEDYLAVCLGIQ